MFESIDRKITLLLIVLFFAGCDDFGGRRAGREVVHKSESRLYDLTMNDIDGEAVSLSSYRGKVLMIVNVASKCGFTPQYAQLQNIYEKYNDSGFFVLGFPANNFGNQEPGSNEEIKNFCSSEYHISFPIFSKISVKGQDKHRLYKFLTEAESNPKFAGQITWNFNKFLLSRDGKILNRFSTKVKPDAPEVLEAIEQALEQ